MSYNPLDGVRQAKRAMDRFVNKHTVPPLTVSMTTGPVACCVFLQTLVDGGPVPDDFLGLHSGAAIQAHVRPDGAVYLGAFELQGDRSSVVLVYGPPAFTQAKAERLATLERPALAHRHRAWKLGPFAAHPISAVHPERPQPTPTQD